MRRGLATRALLPALCALLLAPAGAQAHGASDPAASDYLARITNVPAGLQAKVVDGDLRLWLKVPTDDTVIVPDYLSGVPYLRFSHGEVDANENAEMFYFNQTPPTVPPIALGRHTRPDWTFISRSDTYEWHDARLGGLADIAIAPGTSYVGPWRLRLLVNGRPASISGALLHRGAPSIIWLWPIVVLFACVLAAWRLDSRDLDRRLARGLARLVLVAVLLGAVGRDLHGRPGLSAFSLAILAILALIAAWSFIRLVRRQDGFLVYLVIAAIGGWEGGVLIPTLFHGYVLLAIPAFPARVADVLCLGGSIALLALAWRLYEAAERAPEGQPAAPARLTV